jgi:alpha-tubulin suppressor-like RCC1 family protein
LHHLHAPEHHEEIKSHYSPNPWNYFYWQFPTKTAFPVIGIWLGHIYNLDSVFGQNTLFKPALDISSGHYLYTEHEEHLLKQIQTDSNRFKQIQTDSNGCMNVITETRFLISRILRKLALGIPVFFFLITKLIGTEAGSLWVMGSNWSGYLGLGNTGSANEYFRVQAVPEGVVKVAAANDSEYQNLFYLDSAGDLWAAGVLPGDPTRWSVNAFEKVDSNVAEISCAGLMAAYIKKDGSLWIWGAWTNEDSNMNNKDPVNHPPTKIVDSDVIAVSIAGEHSFIYDVGVHVLFIKSDDNLWGFGHNGYGQLGLDKRIGDYAASTDWGKGHAFEPDPKHICSGVRKAWAFPALSFFLKQDGSLWGMGYNDCGLDFLEVDKKEEDYSDEDSDGDRDFYEPSPVLVNLSNVVDVAMNASTFYYVDSDGVLRGRGASTSGQLGEVRAWNASPISDYVEIDSEVTEVEGGLFDHVLYKKSDGSLWGLGNNGSGQLGLGKTVDDYTDLNGDGRVDEWDEMIETDPQIIIESGVTQFAAGTNFSAYVTGTGTSGSNGTIAELLWGELKSAQPQTTTLLDEVLVGSTALYNGWYFSSWFGFFYHDASQADTKWCYHRYLGWLYFAATKSDSVWIWSDNASLGWIWTNSTLFTVRDSVRSWPGATLYRNSDSSWLFYMLNEDNSSATYGKNWFYNFATSAWASY